MGKKRFYLGCNNTPYIFLADMGDFIDSDQRKTVTQGRAAILNSPVVSCFPRPQVTWFRDGYKIIPSNRV